MTCSTASRRVAYVSALLLTVVAFSVPASAAAPRFAGVSTFSGSNCPANRLCLYRDYNYTGGGVAIARDGFADWFGDSSLNFNDQMSSWSNDSGVTCAWYSDADYRATRSAMGNGERGDVPQGLNDTASSARCKDETTHPFARVFTGSNCPTNSLCMYRNSDFSGGGVALKRGDSARDLGGDLNFNDQMSSWANDSGVTCYWFKHADFIHAPDEKHQMNNRYRVELPWTEAKTASSASCDA